MIRIQLLGQNAGYLDVIDDSVLAITLAVADIKDISKRSGSFSKTIMLPGTKNNNRLLNDYFEVNVIDGTFSINKVQRCLLLDNNVPIFNNMVLQLISVNKEQATNMEDDIVEYEVSIKDTTADFFTIINNRYLNQLDFSEFGHTYSSQEIFDSFSHSYVDGYKYVIPFGDDNKYPLTELKPAIYAKQYWEKIHADAGFSYVWSSETNANVRFDKLLIPYSSGSVKLGEDAISKSRVIATGPSGQDFISPTTTIQPPYLWRGGDQSKVTVDTEIVDPLNAYNIANSRFISPFYVTQPSCYEYIVEFDYDVIVDNLQALNATILASNAQYYGQINVVSSVYNRRTGVFDSAFVNSSPLASIEALTFVPGETIVFSGTAKVLINTSNHQLGDELELWIGLQHAAGFNSPIRITRICDFKVRLTSDIKVTIQLNSTQIYNSYLDLNQYLPIKIKQSDFVKSIMMMYNLFVEVDPVDPNLLIYTSRDEFYDTGALVDWTSKLARDKEQNLRFLPELSSKSIIFTYKPDDDPANKGYQDVVNEIYGQHQVIFSNNYVRGIETKELIFSPTPFQVSDWNSFLPLIPSGDQKFNIRILVDNGNLPCQPWFLIDYIDPNISLFPPIFSLGSWVEANYYPFVAHLDAPTNPTFDLNFGVCDFYFSDIRNITNNNLFNNFWRRTCGQINNGKLLTAYFHLKSSDVMNLRLNAKIRIDNSYWNINKIIDFDANKQELTKVELISIDDEVLLPAFGQDSQFFTPGQQLPPTFDPVFISTNDIISKSVTQRYNDLNHISRTTNNSNNGVISLGSFNRIDGGVKGVIVGDFIHATQSGLYVGQNTFIGDNLGNVGGLPSTLVVDNTTGGNNIVVSPGDFITSPSTFTLELKTDAGVYIEASDGVSRINALGVDQTSGYSFMYANENALNFNTKVEIDYSTIVAKYFDSTYTTGMEINANQIRLEHSDSSNYVNFVQVNNTAANGVEIRTQNITTSDIGSIVVTDTNIIITNPTLLVLDSPLINIPNLNPYADDAAAGAGGLNSGDLYQTDGTGALTTAGIVMIKQ